MKKPIKKKLPKYPLGGKKPIAPAAIQTDPNYNVMLNQGDDNVEPQRVYDKRSQNQLIQDQRNSANNQMINQTVSGAANALAQTGGKLRSVDLGSVGKGMGWLGLATAAEGIGKSFISKDENGNYKTNIGKAANEIITPDHEQMLNDIQNKKYGLALLDSTGLGKFARMTSYLTGNSKKTTGGWGKFNKLVGVPQELKPEEVKPEEVKPIETFDKDYRQDAVWQQRNNYQEFAMGGIHSGIPNSLIEKQEVVQNPDGTTQQVNVGTHESGNDAQVNLEPGARVFSDRLKLPGSKKTIAKEAEAFKTNKEEKVLSDPKSTSTSKNTAKLISDMKQRKLDELFQAQEALKQSKVLNYAKKLGVNIPQNQFKMGGKKCYPNGGEYTTPDPYSNQVQIPMTPINNTNNPVYNWNYLPTSQAPVINDSNSSSYDAMRSRNIYEGIGNGLVQNAGNFYDLYQTNMGKKYDIEDYGSVNPRYYNPKTISATESLRDADRQAAASRYALRNAVGGNTGAYLANLAATQTANTLNKAKIRESINNTNTNILNQADLTNTSIRNDAERYNLDLKNRAKVDTSMNKARSEDIARQAVRGIGENLSESYKDYKLGEQDQKKLALINQIFPNYKFNPNNFEFYYRSAKQANKPKKEKE